MRIYLKKVRMKKIYCNKYKNHKNFKKFKISSICYETLLLSSICNTCESEVKEIFKEEQSTEILKILGLNNDM